MVPESGAMIAGHRVEEFIPERWLPEAKAEFGSDRKTAHRPFSVGPQSYFGQDLAFFVTRLIVSKLLWNYNLELLPESKNWAYGRPSWSTRVKPPLMVKVTPFRDLDTV
ncbi:hypothetical protein VF21_04130 [Pseudogymnoascus sp. 05NY08]|nr:hypothetical protein VF21_04130 [Pseudogymnoascus sp. 05NY08]